MDDAHDLEELEEVSGRNARDAADLDAGTAHVLLERGATRRVGPEPEPERTEPTPPGSVR